MDEYFQNDYTEEKIQKRILDNFINTIFNCSIDNERLHKILIIIPIYKLVFEKTDLSYGFCNLCKQNKNCNHKIVDIKGCGIMICENCKITTQNIINWYLFTKDHFVPNIKKMNYDNLLKYILINEFLEHKKNFLYIVDTSKNIVTPIIPNTSLEKRETLPEPKPPMEPII